MASTFLEVALKSNSSLKHFLLRPRTAEISSGLSSDQRFSEAMVPSTVSSLISY
jgi:hypothetical protein